MFYFHSKSSMCSESKINDAEFGPAIIKAQIPLVEKIIRDETWYEGERRGCRVERDDIRVQRRVAEIVISSGDWLYSEAKTAALKLSA